MKIHIANYEERIGGGWSWMHNWVSHESQVSYEDADVYLVAGATLASREQIEQAKKDGKKVVLRIDNHLLPSRNRNTGMTKMQDFAKEADVLIYQSKWAHDYLAPVLKRAGYIVLNGVDTKVFNSDNRENNQDYLYIRSSRINEKGWELARYVYSLSWRITQDIRLNIVGKFSGENLDYNFDFFNGEDYKFWGEQPHNIIAQLMKQSKYYLYSHFIEACPNTLIEARASGMEIVDVLGALKSGGAPEVMALKDLSIERMIQEYKDAIGG